MHGILDYRALKFSEGPDRQVTLYSTIMFVCILFIVHLYQVARCTKIINADTDDAKYVINVKQFAKFVVDLGDQVAPTDIEEGMRVGYDSFIHVVSCIEYSLLVPVFSLSPSLSL